MTGRVRQDYGYRVKPEMTLFSVKALEATGGVAFVMENVLCIRIGVRVDHLFKNVEATESEGRQDYEFGMKLFFSWAVNGGKVFARV